jgi:hypothetical protein
LNSVLWVRYRAMGFHPSKARLQVNCSPSLCPPQGAHSIDPLQIFAEFSHGLGPKHAFKVGLLDGREGRESGLWLKTSGATIPEPNCERISSAPFLSFVMGP